MPKRNKVNDNVGIEKYNDHRMAVESIRLGHVLFDDSIWGNLSGESRDFIHMLLCRQGAVGCSAEEALRHPWMRKCIKISAK
jgi:hypothetical protein